MAATSGLGKDRPFAAVAGFGMAVVALASAAFAVSLLNAALGVTLVYAVFDRTPVYAMFAAAVQTPYGTPLGRHVLREEPFTSSGDPSTGALS